MIAARHASASESAIASGAIGIGNLLSLFQHANLRTPRWLGYIIQRPESHAVHHERGVHAGNYGNLAIWDIAFGTFHNPPRAPAQAGFYDGASSRIPEMLVGLAVDTPRREVAEPPVLEGKAA
jgi:sterol desaturase/sphingolipid hydroxylase (fatty acid hydroxylase superfamily)